MRALVGWMLVGGCSGPDGGPDRPAGVEPSAPGSTTPSTATTTAPSTSSAPTSPTDPGPVGFPSVESFDERGPFDTVVDQQWPGCTVHRPATLGVSGLVHPVLLWGNGTGTVPAIYFDLLDHLASHGFIVAAADTSNAGDGSEMLDCLDAVEAAGVDPDSEYFDAVDEARIGTSGHSQGGAGAIMAAVDPRVTAVAPVQPYLWWIPLGGVFDQDSLGLQHAPMLLLSGSDDTLAVPELQQQPVFDEASTTVEWATDLGATHFEPLGDGGDFRAPLTAWFRARLMDDAAAAEQVDLPDCALCLDPAWSVQFN